MIKVIDLIMLRLWDEILRIEGKPGTTVRMIPRDDGNDGIFWVRREDVNTERNNGSDG